MGTLFVDKLDPQSGTSLELGSSGDTVSVNTGATTSLLGNVTLGASGKTITVPSGATIANSGTATGFGESNTPAFQSYLGSDQSVANTTYVVVANNGEVFDEGGCYNNTGSTVTLNGISTPAYSFAPNVAGKYYLYAMIRSDAWTSNGLAAVIKKNNNDIIYGYNTNGESRDNGYTSTWVFGIDSANGTSDTYKIVAWQNNGSTQNINGYASSGPLEWGSTHFGGFLVTT